MELRPFSLDGKTAVVTGASRGIGHAVARVFAQAGADLALVARSQEPLETLAKQIREMGRRALVCPLDVTNWEGIPATMDRIREEYGRIDILVNNAGVWHKGFVDDLTVESWDRMFDTNVKSAFLFCQAVAPIMRQQRWGRIINMGSLAAFTTGLVGAGDYAASKAALHTFTKSLARDLGPDGITANVIAQPSPMRSRSSGWSAWFRCAAWASRRTSPMRRSIWPRRRPATSPGPSLM